MSTCPTDWFSTRTTDRAGRDTMFAEVAKAIGGNVLVVE